MNELEKALTSADDEMLNTYLEIEPTKDIRKHITEIITKERNRTDAGAKLQKIRDILAFDNPTNAGENER